MAQKPARYHGTIPCLFAILKVPERHPAELLIPDRQAWPCATIIGGSSPIRHDTLNTCFQNCSFFHFWNFNESHSALITSLNAKTGEEKYSGQTKLIRKNASASAGGWLHVLQFLFTEVSILGLWFQCPAKLQMWIWIRLSPRLFARPFLGDQFWPFLSPSFY